MKHDKVNGKILIGLIENISIGSNDRYVKEIPAKIDTGATRSSIDIKLASELNLGPVIKSKIVF